MFENVAIWFRQGRQIVKCISRERDLGRIKMLGGNGGTSHAGGAGWGGIHNSGCTACERQCVVQVQSPGRGPEDEIPGKLLRLSPLWDIFWPFWDPNANIFNMVH